MAAVAEDLFGETPSLGGHPTPFSDWPLFALAFPAERAIPAEGGREPRLSLDAHLVRHPDSTLLLRVTGAALREAGLHDGDLLVLDQATPATAGGLVVVAHAGRFWLARIDRDAAGRRVWCAVAATDAAGTLPAPPDRHSVGVVRWVMHRLWPGRAPRRGNGGGRVCRLRGWPAYFNRAQCYAGWTRCSGATFTPPI